VAEITDKHPKEAEKRLRYVDGEPTKAWAVLARLQRWGKAGSEAIRGISSARVISFSRAKRYKN